jgi:NAD(P)-dependent dehydrogenase (short-subunit alcohol dehydrogenase family)
MADSGAALAGQVVAITGASSGIGEATALACAREGAAVALAARRADRIEALAQRIRDEGAQAVAIETDVAEEASAHAFVRGAAERLGGLDALVNNAGVMGEIATNVSAAPLDDAHKTMETNLFGAWRLAQAVLPLLRRSEHGRIVNVSSGAGQLSDMNGGSPGYRISKTALNALTRILSQEEAGSGILANSMCPGWVRTDMGGAAAPRSVEEGADTAVWLATLPDDGPAGGFFRNREPIPW